MPTAEAGEWRAITSTVDDSVIERSTTWKQLATWGGFRRHFKEEEQSSGLSFGHSNERSTESATPMAVAPPPAVSATALVAPAGRVQVQEQLEAKRLEVLLARQRLQEEAKRLEDLLEAQQQLERLLLPSS